MTAPTAAVTVRLADFGGPARAGIKVTARLSDVDYTADGTFVSTEPVTAVTDAGGVAVLNVFPNAVAPGGLGTLGTTIRFTASLKGSRGLDVQAAIPNSACNLVDYLVDQEPNGLGGAERAAAGAQAARDIAVQAASDAGDDATQTAGDRQATATDRLQTGQDRIQTGLDRTATAADRTAVSTARVAAESARDSSVAAATASAVALAAKDTIAIGRASVADGASFWVKPNSTDGLTRFTCYLRTSSTTQTLIGSLASGDDVITLRNGIIPVGFKWAVCDFYGQAAIGLRTTGVFAVASLEVTTMNGQPAAGLFTSSNLVSQSLSSSSLPAGYKFVWRDAQGNAAGGLKDSGAFKLGTLEVTTINGKRAASVVRGSLAAARYSAGLFSADLVFINNAGQSLAEGSNGGNLTPEREFDIIAFPTKPAGVVPGAYFPATTQATGYSGRGEWPGLGMAAMVKNLIADEQAISYTQQGYQLLVQNNAWGGTNITQLSKGGAFGYADAINGIQAAYNIAQGEGRTMKALVTTWTQGETDALQGTAGATYKASLKKLRVDYDADAKAITGQTEDMLLVCAQTNTNQVALVGLKAGSLVGGAGGANGTFAIIFPAVPTGGTLPTGTFTVAGGSVIAVNLATAGAGYGADLPLTNAAFANSAGLAGAAATIAASQISMPIAQAQLDAAAEDPKIVIAGPLYPLTFYDFQHIDSRSSKLWGSLQGLVFKRIAVDGETWTPLQPVSHTKQGKVVLVRFATPVRPLVLDTASLPAQTNGGFTLVDSVGNSLAISSVSVVGPDTVRIVAAAAIPAGAVLRYGCITMTGRSDKFVGGGGNLRDSQGNDIKATSAGGAPLHNWCVIFNRAL